MNVVDSSGWLEYFADASNAKFFAKPIPDTERLHGATVWTQDADFQGIKGVRYIAKTRG